MRIGAPEPETPRAEIPVILPPPGVGLTSEQVRERTEAGLSNVPVEPPTRTVGQIVRSNLLTFFNLLFLGLAVCVAVVTDWHNPNLMNMSFLLIVIVNSVIGIVQELISKRALDKLTILSVPTCRVLRDGQDQTVDVAAVVRDDLAFFGAGAQIYADAQVMSGEVRVNESLVTGESDEIRKRPGDALLSGSFVVNGACTARITAVGAESFVSRLTTEAKQSKKRREPEMMRSLSALIKVIGILVIPFGILMVVKEIFWLGRDVPAGVLSTVASITGMIPEGLYFLTTAALATGAARLAKKKVLLHELGCIETLARVDVLCVDKTGTITENKMVVEDVIPLCEDRYTADDLRLIMADYVYAMQNDNDTMAAMKKYFDGTVQQTAFDAMPFTSVKKYGGVSFHEDETYLLGAPEVLLGDRFYLYRDRVNEYSSMGCRVLLLVNYDGALRDEKLTAGMLPLGLILLSNKIRPEAPDTFRYFADQGVTVKVISGDNPLTVSEVARRAGIPGTDRWVDARTLTDDNQLFEAARDCNVFGRVTPDQKRRLVRALKQQGHTVAMTGDGVNDILALKAADCSIAVASGSEAARQVADVVLMNSDFSSMPGVVGEGRRVINNITRSASLYLVKNIFTFVLALVTVIFVLPYPFAPSQIAMTTAFTIGIPAFVLAMEPSSSRVRGKFLPNVLWRALPAGLTDVVLIIGVILFYLAFQLKEGALSTICTGVMGVVGLLMVHRTCKPYTKLRTALIIFLTVGYTLTFILFGKWFALSALKFADLLVMVVLMGLAWPVMHVLSMGTEKLRGLFPLRILRKDRMPAAAAEAGPDPGNGTDAGEGPGGTEQEERP